MTTDLKDTGDKECCGVCCSVCVINFWLNRILKKGLMGKKHCRTISSVLGWMRSAFWCLSLDTNCLRQSGNYWSFRLIRSFVHLSDPGRNVTTYGRRSAGESTEAKQKKKKDETDKSVDTSVRWEQQRPTGSWGKGAFLVSLVWTAGVDK